MACYRGQEAVCSRGQALHRAGNHSSYTVAVAAHLKLMTPPLGCPGLFPPEHSKRA